MDDLHVALLAVGDPRAVQRPAGLLAVVADRDRDQPARAASLARHQPRHRARRPARRRGPRRAPASATSRRPARGRSRRARACARRPREAPAAQERLARGGEVAAVAGEVLADELGHGLVADQVLHHARRAPVVGIERGERRAQALVGILDAGPGPDVGHRVLRRPVRGAGGEERGLVGEVAVDGRAAHAGVLGQRADRRARRADRAVQRDGALGDAPARGLLELGALLHPVWALFVSHACPINIDTSRGRRYIAATLLFDERRRHAAGDGGEGERQPA